MSERYQVTQCDDGTWMVHTQGDVIAYAAQGGSEGKARRVANALNILSFPTLEPFSDAVVTEAQYQVFRWGDEHDMRKTAWDWFWTLGHLGSKAAHSALAGDYAKAKHHTITAAAMLANWHRHISAAETDGCPRLQEVTAGKGAPE